MAFRSASSNFSAARLLLVFSLFLISSVAFAYEPQEGLVRAPKSDEESLGAKGAQQHQHADYCSARPQHHEGAAFDPGQLIMHHIADDHVWHIVNHVQVPLPVILKTDKGFEFFMSSKFYDEHHNFVAYQGTHYTYTLIDGKVHVIDPSTCSINEAASHSILDLSITKNVLTMLVVFALMFFIFLKVAKAYRRRAGQAPRGLQSFMEPLIVFVRDDVAKPSIGEKKHERYMPYLLTCFFFIWISNLLGLIPIIPGGANLTGNIAITATLAVFTFLITTFSGNAHYWRHILAMPGVPAGILVLLTPIEILGMFLRPFVLMIRLFANITAGHIIALAFFSLIFIFGKNGESLGGGLGVAVVSVAFTVFMFAMELLVAFLQAYVFTLLSAIYIGSAVEEGHHDDHHDHAHDAHAKHPEAEMQAVV
jgi:F-type H+-transporting ATPase subunit a